MIGATLESLIDQLRSELAMASSPAQGQSVRHVLMQLVQGTQKRLYSDYNWPHLKVTRDETLMTGQRYYSYDPDIDFSRILKAEVNHAGCWREIGLLETRDLNEIDSDAGTRSDPVRKWRNYETGQFEVWPVPAAAGQKLRFTAIRKLNPLVADADTADLDDHLIVLYAAARRLKNLKAEDADNVLREANQHFNRLKASYAKSRTFVMGESDPRESLIRDPEWKLRVAGT